MKYPEKDFTGMKAFYAVVSFLFPVIGLIFILVLSDSDREYRKDRAKLCRKATAIGIFAYIVVGLIYCFINFTSISLIFQIVSILIIILGAMTFIFRYVFQDYYNNAESRVHKIEELEDFFEKHKAIWIGPNNNWYLGKVDTDVKAIDDEGNIVTNVEKVSISKRGSYNIHFSNGEDVGIIP